MSINDNFPLSYNTNTANSSSWLGPYTASSGSIISGVSNLKMPPHYIPHSLDLDICPECDRTTDDLNRELLLLAPEVCECDPSNSHTVDQWWHKKCYDEKGRNLWAEWEEVFSELQAETARHSLQASE